MTERPCVGDTEGEAITDADTDGDATTDEDNERDTGTDGDGNGVNESSGVGTTAQAVPLVHVDVTVVPKKEMLANVTPRAVATACLASIKLVPVSATIRLLAETRAPAADAGKSTGTVMAR